MNDPLSAYLHDHLAGANFAIELLEDLRDRHSGEPLGQFAADELQLVLEDRRILESITHAIGSEPSTLKEAATWVAEKASRFKLRHPASPEFGAFEALEVLKLGIHGRAGLWRALSLLRGADSRLPAQDFEALATRAEAQRDRVEQRRLQLAPSALTPQPSQ